MITPAIMLMKVISRRRLSRTTTHAAYISMPCKRLKIPGTEITADEDRTKYYSAVTQEHLPTGSSASLHLIFANAFSAVKKPVGEAVNRQLKGFGNQRNWVPEVLDNNVFI